MYVSTLDSAQGANAAIAVKEAKVMGVTNMFAIGGILAVMSKESEFRLKSEMSYAHTPNAIIRKVFGSHFATLSEDQLSVIKMDDKAFFDKVYGGMYGNSPDEGYKYRGRGFNDETFKDNYAAFGRELGIDLVGNPDLLNTPKVAADVAVCHFKDGVVMLKNLGKLAWYNATSINDFKNTQDAAKAIYHVNAGVGHDLASLEADPTGGRAKTLSRVDELYTFALSIN